MGRHQATIAHLWQDLDSFLKIILCEKCDNRFENETEVMIHIRNVHYKDVRKMFASDAIEHLEADQEYHMGQILQDGENVCFMSNFF